MLLFLGSLCLSQQCFLYSLQVVVFGEFVPQSTILPYSLLVVVVREFVPQSTIFSSAFRLMLLGS